MLLAYSVVHVAGRHARYHVCVGHPLMRYILARFVACLTVTCNCCPCVLEKKMEKKKDFKKKKCELGGILACGELAAQPMLLQLLHSVTDLVLLHCVL